MTRSKRMGKRKTGPLLLGALVLIVAATAGTFFALNYYDGTRADKERQDVDNKVEELLSSEGGQPSASQTKEYYDADEILYTTDPAEWGRKELDAVYYHIAYNEKLDAYGPIAAALSKLDEAARAGVDLDDNSFGRGEEYRSGLRNKIKDSPLNYYFGESNDSTEEHAE